MDSQSPLSGRMLGIGAAVIALVIIGALVWPQLSGQDNAQPETNEANNVTETTNENTTDTGSASEETNISSIDASAIESAQSAEELFTLGESFYRDEKWDSAIAAYQKAIDLNPNYDAAYTNLGSTYYRMEEVEQAIAAYQQALNLVPDDADTHHNLGMVYLQEWISGNPQDPVRLEQALDEINKAIELDPSLPAPHYGLGVIYQVQDDIPAAISAYERFLELDDGSDPIATSNATQILEQLKAQ